MSKKHEHDSEGSWHLLWETLEKYPQTTLYINEVEAEEIEEVNTGSSFGPEEENPISENFNGPLIYYTKIKANKIKKLTVAGKPPGDPDGGNKGGNGGDE